jgi:uncharacterized protein YggE
MKFLIAFISLCITITAIVYIKQNPKTTSSSSNSSRIIEYIDVSGQHSETFSSDQIVWVLQISLMGKEKEQLLIKKNERIKELTTLVSSIGIDPNNLSFENYTLRKQWNWDRGKRTFESYQLNQTIKVQLTSEEKSDLLSEGIIQINDIEIVNVRYEIADIEEKTNQISAKAFKKAKDKAKFLAKTSGKEIETVISISENPINNEPIILGARNGLSKASLFDSSTPGSNGPTKTTLESQVFVRFLLKDADKKFFD